MRRQLAAVSFALLALLSVAPLAQAQTNRPSGTVVSWGWSFPYLEPGTRFTAIAAGYSHTVALKSDGAVVAWGADDTRQTTVPSVAKSAVVAIAAGPYHSAALKSDGSVVQWGFKGMPNVAVPAAAQSGVAAIAAGRGHTVALKTDGSVVAWGGNWAGQVTGTPATGSTVTAVAAPVTLSGQVLSEVIAITAGALHTVALKSDGSVVAWGDNSTGQTDVPIAAQSGVVAIAAAGYGEGPTPGGHTVALKSDGSVIAWGDDSSGQTDVPIAAQSGVVGIAAAAFAKVVPGSGLDPATPGGSWTTGAHTVALKKDGSVVAWGDNTYGQTVVPGAAHSGVIAIATAGARSLALKNDGSILTWGDDGSSAAAKEEMSYLETQVPGASRHLVAIAEGGYHVLGLRDDGSVVAWGRNDAGESTVPVGAQSSVVAIAAGGLLGVLPGGGFLTGGHSLALKSDGSVVVWGNDEFGQIDLPIEAQKGAVGIAAGNWHSAVLKSNGSVLAWGRDDFGETVVPVEAQSGVMAIAAGYGYTAALKNDGSVVAWGNPVVAAVPVAAKSEVKAIASGLYHVLALKNDGSVVAWGDSGYRQTVVPLAAKSGVVAIAAGDVQSAALKSDGSIVAWGAGGQSIVPSDLAPVLALLAVNYAFVRDPPPSLTVLRNADHTLSLSWTGAGALEQTDSLTAPSWQPADSQANPQSISPAGLMSFFRLKAE